MRITNVNVIYKRKIELKGYNSAEISAMLSAEIEEGDDLNQCMRDLWTMVKSNVKSQIVPLAQEVQNTIVEPKEYYLGLPLIKQESE